MQSLLVVMLLVVSQSGKSEDTKVHLTIYYESMCPDSVKFIVTQLVPAMELLNNYLVLTFVPFGKAYSINGGFSCQHGPSECLGNIVQDCALNIMYKKRASDSQKLSYVSCEMRSFAAARGDYSCVNQNDYLKEREVRQCANSNDGIQLQLNSEYATHQLKPSFIPTITINNVFDQQNQNTALRDLKGTLCSYLGDIPPCARYNNHQNLQYFL